MPRHHDVRAEDIDFNRLGAVLAVAYERDLRNFADFLLTEKLGPRTLQTLAMVAEVIDGTPVRFSDPARYSFALGGKDGHPFPVPLKTYDESIDVLRRSLDVAKVDGPDKLEGFRKLNNCRLKSRQVGLATESRLKDAALPRPSDRPPQVQVCPATGVRNRSPRRVPEWRARKSKGETCWKLTA